VNAYWCHLEGRIVGRSYEPPDPGEYMVPCGIYLAETRGRAKLMLIADHGSDVDAEEFVDVRTRILGRDLDALAGPLDEPKPGDPVYEAMVDGGDPPAESLYARLWLRVHEIEDHGGAACDRPIEEER
jgi:hypothetical protein